MKQKLPHQMNQLKVKAKKALSLPLRLPSSYEWRILYQMEQDLGQFLNDLDRKRFRTIVRNRDMFGLLALGEEWGLQSISPTDTSIVEIRAKYQLCALLKKFPFPGDKQVRKLKALEIFSEAEAVCRRYNEGEMEITPFNICIREYAKAFIKRVLGEFPISKEVLSESRHGPGANLDSSRSKGVSLYHKYMAFPYSCTSRALPYARFAIQTDQRWFGALQDEYRNRFKIPKHFPISQEVFWKNVVKVVEHNRITTVPKDAKRDRTIAVEPALNIYLQLGVDGYIRKRLKRYGVDLDSQEKNQWLAYKGSVGNGYATIDLRSASDTVSVKLVEELFPPLWSSYLIDLSCREGLVGKDLISYEKISSMGNGFTFAIESLIFTALVFAVTKYRGLLFDKREFAIFGDDIIVRSELYFMLVEGLRLFGFELNLDKTFFYGGVRESCGTDWVSGYNVRPVFLSRGLDTVNDLYSIHNRLKRVYQLYYALDWSQTRICNLLLSWIPEGLRLFGPNSNDEVNSYLHSDKPIYKWDRRGQGWSFFRVVERPVELEGRWVRRFLMRKLMHDLRPLRPIQWAIGQLGQSGSRFTVFKKYLRTVGFSYSTTDMWLEYHYSLPIEPVYKRQDT